MLKTMLRFRSRFPSLNRLPFSNYSAEWLPYLPARPVICFKKLFCSSCGVVRFLCFAVIMRAVGGMGGGGLGLGVGVVVTHSNVWSRQTRNYTSGKVKQ